MKRTIRVLEDVSEWSGRIFMWFCLTLVLLLTFEVFMRYVLSSPTIFSYEISTMMGVTIAAGGLAFAHKYQGHVRVDVFWRLLSHRGKAIADMVGAILFFFPFLAILMYVSSDWALRSFVEHEIMTKTYLYPPAWPVRAVMALGVLLFILQGIAKFLRDLYYAGKNEEV